MIHEQLNTYRCQKTQASCEGLRPNLPKGEGDLSRLWERIHETRDNRTRSGDQERECETGQRSSSTFRDSRVGPLFGVRRSEWRVKTESETMRGWEREGRGEERRSSFNRLKGVRVLAFELQGSSFCLEEWRAKSEDLSFLFYKFQNLKKNWFLVNRGWLLFWDQLNRNRIVNP